MECARGYGCVCTKGAGEGGVDTCTLPIVLSVSSHIALASSMPPFPLTALAHPESTIRPLFPLSCPFFVSISLDTVTGAA